MFQIRNAQKEDLPYLADIELAAATLYPEDIIPLDQQGLSYPDSEFQKSLQQGLLFCVTQNNKRVAFATCHQYQQFLHLDEISVHPASGKQGIGTALVKRILQESQSRKLQGTTLTTFSNIPWNAPFYKKMGFNILSNAETPDEVKDMLLEENFIGLKNRVAMFSPNTQ